VPLRFPNRQATLWRLDPLARQAFVCEAELTLPRDTDPAAVGAAVTAALCGDWEHQGPCRWPHNSHIEPEGDAFAFKTVFVADIVEGADIQKRIGDALRGQEGWTVRRMTGRAVAPSEEPLAQRLARLGEL
jgi:hypothetical protein